MGGVIPKGSVGETLPAIKRFTFGPDRIAGLIVGTVDPESVAIEANAGTIYQNETTGALYRKTDSGSTTNWSQTGDKSAIDAIVTSIGAANGICPLDAGAKVPISNIPSSIVGALKFQGTWDASTNTPALANGVGTDGHIYVVSVNGSTPIDGNADWVAGDWIVFNGNQTVWEKVDNNDIVTSVQGKTGAVTISLEEARSEGNQLSGDIDFNNNKASNVSAVGFQGGQELAWNSDAMTVDIPTGLGPVNQAGQELYTIIHNNTGATITNGQVVRITGVFGGRPTVSLAHNRTEQGVTGKILIATMDIPNNTNGIATGFGRVVGLDTSGYTGGVLYIGDVDGELTSTKPVFPKYTVAVAGVIAISATDGIIDVQQGGDVNDTFHAAFDGGFRETFDFRVTSDGTTITGSLTNVDPADDLTMIFSDGFEQLDTTPAATVSLVAGTATIPQKNYIYIPMATKVLTVSTSGFPSDEHIKVADVLVQSATDVQGDGALANRNWNDHLKAENDNGHILHIAERLRQNPAAWDSGVATTLTVTANPSDVTLSSTSGSVYQLHKQTFTAKDMATGDHAHIVNDPTTAYRKTSNLNDITEDATGTSINNKWFSLVVWAVANKTGEPSSYMVNLPNGSYNLESNAINDSDGFSVYTIPAAFKGVGFLVGRFTVKKSGTTWTYNAGTGYVDLRGFLPNNTAGSGSGGSGVTDHNALQSIQGGTTDEYYHLTSEEHTKVVNLNGELESRLELGDTVKSSIVHTSNGTSQNTAIYAGEDSTEGATIVLRKDTDNAAPSTIAIGNENGVSQTVNADLTQSFEENVSFKDEIDVANFITQGVQTLTANVAITKAVARLDGSSSSVSGTMPSATTYDGTKISVQAIDLTNTCKITGDFEGGLTEIIFQGKGVAEFIATGGVWKQTNSNINLPAGDAKQYDISSQITGASSIDYAIATPYKDENSVWRMKFNFRWSESSTTTASITIGGISIARAYQSLDGWGEGFSSTYFAWITSSAILTIESSTAVAGFIASGDIELSGKPTWADDYALASSGYAFEAEMPSNLYWFSLTSIPTTNGTYTRAQLLSTYGLTEGSTSGVNYEIIESIERTGLGAYTINLTSGVFSDDVVAAGSVLRASGDVATLTVSNATSSAVNVKVDFSTTRQDHPFSLYVGRGTDDLLTIPSKIVVPRVKLNSTEKVVGTFNGGSGEQPLYEKHYTIPTATDSLLIDGTLSSDDETIRSNCWVEHDSLGFQFCRGGDVEYKLDNTSGLTVFSGTTPYNKNVPLTIQYTKNSENP